MGKKEMSSHYLYRQSRSCRYVIKHRPTWMTRYLWGSRAIRVNSAASSLNLGRLSASIIQPETCACVSVQPIWGSKYIQMLIFLSLALDFKFDPIKFSHSMLSSAVSLIYIDQNHFISWGSVNFTAPKWEERCNKQRTCRWWSSRAFLYSSHFGVNASAYADVKYVCCVLFCAIYIKHSQWFDFDIQLLNPKYIFAFEVHVHVGAVLMAVIQHKKTEEWELCWRILLRHLYLVSEISIPPNPTQPTQPSYAKVASDWTQNNKNLVNLHLKRFIKIKKYE